MSNNIKAIGYVRCSTHEQADSGLGLDAQRERIRSYCSMRSLHMVTTLTDAGVSGSKPLASRDGGRELILKLKSPDINTVVCLRLDRMFRNAADCLTTAEAWEKSGVALHIVDLGGNAIDTTSAAGRFMLVVLAGAAEMERNLISERTRSAMAIKKANGHRVGRIPYGYDLSTDGAMLLSNAEEQATIQRMVCMHGSGLSISGIARVLTADGVKTKTRRSPHWTHQAVCRILKRQGYGRKDDPKSRP